MKKCFLILSLIISVFLSTSCNQSTNGSTTQPSKDTTSVVNTPPTPSNNLEKLKLSDLKTACDYVDAMQKLIIAINNEKGDGEISELNDEQKKKIIKLGNKIVKVAGAGDKKYTEAEIKECPNYDDVVGKVKRFEEEWGEELKNNSDEESGDIEL